MNTEKPIDQIERQANSIFALRSALINIHEAVTTITNNDLYSIAAVLAYVEIACELVIPELSTSANPK